jgi:hypothetical protein
MAQSRIPSGWRRWIYPATYAYQPENGALRLATKIVVATVGASVVLVGVIMIVTVFGAVIVAVESTHTATLATSRPPR